MTLFISNPSRQEVIFYYRRAKTNDSSGPASVHIPSGGNVEVGYGWTRPELDYVISQIEAQGGANAAVAHGRMGKFSGLLWRENHPVDVEEIVAAHEGVLAAADDRSIVQATRGALAFDRLANKGRRERIAKITEVEVKQELAPHDKATGNEVHFKMSVDPDGSADARGIPGLA